MASISWRIYQTMGEIYQFPNKPKQMTRQSSRDLRARNHYEITLVSSSNRYDK